MRETRAEPRASPASGSRSLGSYCLIHKTGVDVGRVVDAFGTCLRTFAHLAVCFLGFLLAVCLMASLCGGRVREYHIRRFPSASRGETDATAAVGSREETAETKGKGRRCMRQRSSAAPLLLVKIFFV